jgi:hypothetical protein
MTMTIDDSEWLAGRDQLHLEARVDGAKIPIKMDVRKKDTPDEGIYELNVSYSWKQRFPPEKAVRISLSYIPILGTGPLDETHQEYCTSGSFLPSLHALRNRAKALPTGDEVDFWLHSVGVRYFAYVLKTAAAWAGPIGDFSLTIDSGTAKSLVSLCWDGELKKVGPTTIQAHEKDFVPSRDLEILFVRDPADKRDLELPRGEGGSICRLDELGATDRAVFDSFDKRLRAAAASDDARELSRLVKLPLRVNRDHRNIQIKTTEEFLRDASKIFTPGIRRGISEQHGFSCASGGLMYAGGAVRVKLDRSGRYENYVVFTVNAGDVDAAARPSRTNPERKMACRTPRHLVIVDDIGDGKLRLRSWSLGAEPERMVDLATRPDLELNDGRSTSAGTGPCSHQAYSFTNNDAEYSISEPGCTDGSLGAARGSLSVRQHGKSLGEWPCGDE